jgi:hypothetical protein
LAPPNPRAVVAKDWKEAGVTAKDLAEHLYATSCGLKQGAKTPVAYRAGMRTALKVVGAVLSFL